MFWLLLIAWQFSVLLYHSRIKPISGGIFVRAVPYQIKFRLLPDERRQCGWITNLSSCRSHRGQTRPHPGRRSHPSMVADGDRIELCFRVPPPAAIRDWGAQRPKETRRLDDCRMAPSPASHSPYVYSRLGGRVSLMDYCRKKPNPFVLILLFSRQNLHY